MLKLLQAHPSEEILEGYAFGRLDAASLESFEEHLLICEECQSALDQTEDYIRLMKAAAREFEERAPESWRWPWPRWGAAVAAAVVCFAGLFYLRPAPANIDVPVALVSTRGEASVAHAPAHRVLGLDVAEPLAAGSYRVEVVTEAGRVVWTRQTEAGSGKLSVRVREGLGRGAYWVRVYDASGLLREFGLRVE